MSRRSLRRWPVVTSVPWGGSTDHQVSPVHLLRYPLAFTQNSLLDPDGFIKAAGERGVRLQVEHLAELHRVRALVPMLRVLQRPARGTRPIELSDTTEQLHETGTPLELSVWGARNGHLIDPATAPYRRWDSGLPIRVSWGVTRYPSVYYSPYQLLGLKTYEALTSRMHGIQVGENRIGFHLSEKLSSRDVGILDGGRRLATLLHGFDVRYLPAIILTASYGTQWRAVNEVFEPASRLSDFGLTPEAIASVAKCLLVSARSLDPMGEWFEIVRHGHPKTWTALKGDARLAMDYRIAAEMLLRTLDDLGRPDLSSPPAREGRQAHATLDDRLRPEPDRLEPELTGRGLYPVPALLLVLEGPSECLLMGHLLDLVFGRSVPRSLIDIVDMEGIDRDLTLLVRREIVPWLGADHGKFVFLKRPPTRVLIAVDPEKRYGTTTQREREQVKLVEQMFRTLDEKYRTETVRQELSGLIEMHSWGQFPWEFANFTIQELATAVRQCGHLDASVSRAQVIEALKAERARTNRLPDVEDVAKRLGGRVSKVKLAESLRDPLLTKAKRELAGEPPYRTPAVRVAMRAAELALTVHRRNVVLPVDG